MFTELTLIICLLDNANKCREEHMTFQDVSILTCAISGQAQVANYMERFPRWYVKRWTCDAAGKFAKI
jgi:hypothetical protein